MADYTEAELDELTWVDHELFHTPKGKPRPCAVPSAPVADTHGHLTLLTERTPARALVRAALAGVRLLINPVDPTALGEWADPDELEELLSRSCADARAELAMRAEAGFVPPDFGEPARPGLTEQVFIVAGTHPYGADRFDAAAQARLAALLESPRCVGIGEIGLDLGPHHILPLEVQEDVFRAQLRLAHEQALPVQLHLRDSADDPTHTAHTAALRILREEGVPEAGCEAHCFTDGVEVMEPFLELGCYIAFGGAATFAKSDAIREAVRACPADRILSETDCPYMAPTPLRGQECEPAMVVVSAARIAEERAQAGEDLQATYQALWDNAHTLFLGGRP